MSERDVADFIGEDEGQSCVAAFFIREQTFHHRPGNADSSVACWVCVFSGLIEYGQAVADGVRFEMRGQFGDESVKDLPGDRRRRNSGMSFLLRRCQY